MRAEILKKKGKENMSIGGKEGLSIVDKPLHNTRQEVASSLNWSTGKVAMKALVRS